MISLITPTRARPGRFLEMSESAVKTASSEIEFCVYVDEDDPQLEAYQALALFSNQIRLSVGPRCVLSEAWNRAAEMAQGDILMLCADDLLFRTKGWDQRIREEFEKVPDRIVLVHGRDGYQDARLATHPFLHRRWIDVVGTFMPVYFSAWYNDTWLTEVADRIGRRVFLSDVLIEHMHPAPGKVAMDRTYEEQEERRQRDDMDNVFASLAGEREQWARRLLKATA